VSWLRRTAHALMALALTLLTQVGGALYLLALFLRGRVRGLRDKPRLALALCFVGLYGLTWFPVQAAASLSGRVGLPCAEQGALRAATPLYCIAHRHYVRPQLRALAQDMARAVDQQYPGTLTLTLDAGFPFFDGFPLLPHLSHDDGRKLDVAFYYARRDTGDHERGGLRSPFGYWAFEEPAAGERQPCRGRAGALRWDQAWFQPLTRNDLTLDGRRLAAALSWLEHDGRARRALLEPHLADRLGANAGFVRFQGCAAARHDDHFHIELR
jgi:hypothetical protein